MSKNKKNFFIGEIGSAVLFLVGVIFLIIPVYYGLDNIEEIESNNLFISMTIIYAIINIVFSYLMGNSPRNENLKLAIASILCGIVNVAMSFFLTSSFTLSVSLLLFTLSITGVKLYTVDYYHDNKDPFYYIEGILTFMFFVVGMLLSILLFNEPLLQIIELGFFVIVLSMTLSLKIATKCLLKAPRFLGKIKF